jgi:hypothetical protein
MTTQIYINNQLADIPVDLSIDLNYQIQDIRNVGNTNASFSRTISFPGTLLNNNIFNNIFDINMDSEFNPNKKAFITIYDGGLMIFDGYLKLDRIIINKDLTIQYECTAFSNIGEFFSEISNFKLNELNLSEYNHFYTRRNVVGSWDSHIVKFNNEIPFKKGEGYVYPYIDYKLGKGISNNRSVEFFRPAVYVKTILDKIFEKAGFTYQSNFFNTDYFKSLTTVFPLNNQKYSENDINNSKLKATLDYDRVETIVNNIPVYYTSPDYVFNFNNDSTNGNFDNGNNYDNTTFIYKAPTTGEYKIRASVEVTNGFGDSALAPNTVVTRIILGRVEYTMDVILVRNNVETVVDTMTQIRDFNEVITFNNQYLIETPLVCTSDQLLLKDDELYVKTYYKLLNFYVFEIGGDIKETSSLYKQFSGGEFEVTLNNTYIREGEYYDLNKLLTDDLAIEFITSLNKMFNLVYEDDSNKAKNILVEPRSNFFKGSVIDWTYKHDRNSEAEVIPVSEINAKQVEFTNLEDGDFYNDDYQNSFNEVYGSYVYEIDNDFVDKTSNDLKQTIFASTPLIDEEISGNKSGRIISTIIKRSENGDGVYDSNKMRILFYGGLLDCDLWRMRSFFDSPINFTKYPYAGYLDNPFSPSEDINFWFPQTYYYERNNLTNSNLINKYWRTFLDELYSKDSKLFIGDFYLDSNDIYNFSFRNIIYFDRKYWIVNKIIDYNPLSNSTTRVELLSIKNYLAPQSFVSDNENFVNLNGGGFFVNNRITIRNNREAISVFTNNLITGLENTFGSESFINNLIIGNSNFIGSQSSSVIVSGNNNFLGGNSSSSLLAGDDNNFNSGMRKSAVFGSGNTSDRVVDKSFIMGDNNDLSAVTQSFIFGDDNSLSAITNCFVVGSGVTFSNFSNAFLTRNAFIQNLSATTLTINPSNIPASGSKDYIQFASTTGGLDSYSGFTFDKIDIVFNIKKNTDRFLTIDTDNGFYGIGDMDGLGNKTNIQIDDANNEIRVETQDFVMNGVTGYTGNIVLSGITEIIVQNGIIVGYI